MPLYEIPGPNGKIYEIEGPEGASRDEIINAITSQHEDFAPPPDPVPEKELAGYFEGLKGGSKRLVSQAKTALGALPFVDVDEAAVEGIERTQNITEQPATSLEAVKKAYNEEGLLSATGEVASQIPGAFGEQTPILASIWAGAKLGFKLPGPPQVKAFGALAGSLMGLFLQSTGGAIERKAQEQIKRGEDVDIDKLGAIATGLGTAALERAALGFSGVSKLLGINIAKTVTNEARERLARQSLKAAIAKGAGRLIVGEGTTEMAQAALERFYADLPLTNDEAKKEYAEAAYGASLLFPLGMASGVSARGRARDEIQVEETKKENDLKDIRRQSNKAYANRLAIAAENNDIEAVNSVAVDAIAEANETLKTFENNAPEKSKLFNIINKASNELNNSKNKNDVKAQINAVNKLLAETDKILPNFKISQQENILGILDSKTLTSFGLTPNSKAHKRLKGLNIATPNNIALFEDTLQKHKGKINEEVITNYTTQIQEANPNVKYKFTGTPAIVDTAIAGRNDLSVEEGSPKATQDPKKSDTPGLGPSVPVDDGPRGRKASLDVALINKAKDLLIANPKKQYKITDLSKALKVSPAISKQIFRALSIDSSIQSKTIRKNNKSIESVQAFPVAPVATAVVEEAVVEEQAAPVRAIPSAVEQLNAMANNKITEEQPVAPAVVEEAVVEEAVVETQVPAFEGKPIPQKLINQHKKMIESDKIENPMSTRPGTIIANNFLKQSREFIGEEVTTTRGRELNSVLNRINNPTPQQIEASKILNEINKPKAKAQVAPAVVEEAALEQAADVAAKVTKAPVVEEAPSKIESLAQQRREESKIIQEAKEADPDSDEYYSLSNDEFVRRPEQIEKFKYVKNLKRALQILKRDFKSDLSEVENILLDTMLNIPNIETTKFSVENIRGAYGGFSISTNAVRVHPNANIGTIIHEAIHATQGRKMDKAFTPNGKPKNEAGRYINDIYNKALEVSGDRFGRELENVFEFVDYALQDVKFQKFLSETPPLNPKNNLNSLWVDMVNAIKRLFNFPNIPNSLLNDYLVIAPDMFDSPLPSMFNKNATSGRQLYQRDINELGEQEAYDPPPSNSNRTFKDFVQGIFNSNSPQDAPKGSLPSKFLRFETAVANSFAPIREKALDASINQAVNDAVTGESRVDIQADVAIQANGFASTSAQLGYVKIDPVTKLATVIEDKNNFDNLFVLVEELSKIAGFGPEGPRKIINRFLGARRFQEENILNEQREAEIEQLELDAKTPNMPKAERKMKLERAANLKNATTYVSPEQLALIPENLEYGNEYPILNEIAEMLKQIQINDINLLESTEVINKEQADYFRNSKGYVPLQRMFNEIEVSNPGVQEYFRGFTDIGQEQKFKGSERQLNDLLDNSLKKHFAIVNSALRNNVSIEAGKFLGITEKNKDGTEVLDAAGKPIVVLHKTIPAKDKYRQEYFAPVVRNGERVYVEYSDTLLAAGMKGPMSPLIETSFFANMATLFRQTITANPVFQTYQVVNDAIGSALYSGVKHPFHLAGRVLKSFPEIIANPNAPILQQMRKAGVTGGYGLTAQEITGKLRRKYNIESEGPIRKSAAYIEDLATYSDLAQRKALFEQVLLETGGVRQPDGTIAGGNQVQAVNSALNIINWQRRGASPAIRLITHTVPFANAYLQGMDILANVAQGKFITPMEKTKARNLFLLTGAKIYVLNLLYTMAVAGDDEYEQMDDREKFRSYMLPGGFKVPVRGELALLLKLIPEGLYNVVTKDGTVNEVDARRIRQAITGSLGEAFFSPNLFPQVFKPTIEVMTNHNFFTGGDIVNPGYRNKETNKQFNENTSELAKLIGHADIISPLSVDHWIKGTTGTAGSLFLYMIDSLANQFYDTKRPETNISRIPVLSAIMYGRNGRSQLTQFYDLADMSLRVTTTLGGYLREGDRKGYLDYREKNKKLIQAKSRINSMKKRVKAIRTRRNRVINDDKMTAKAKGIKLEALSKQMYNVVKDVSRLRSRLDLPLFSTM